VVDHQFADTGLAALYDAFCPWERRDDFRFYFPRLLAARAVLDAGCGTGMLLHRLRDAGHTGRLVGLDPAVGILAVARTRTDVDWFHGDLGSVSFDREFDAVVMTGHAFQVLVTDDDLRAALAAVRAALTPDGRFAFETRNPSARAWETWIPANAEEATGPGGAPVRSAARVWLPVTGDRVSFTSTFTSPAWDVPQTSHSTLRFLDADTLDGFLAEAGLARFEVIHRKKSGLPI
jgi:SAM-dependent methyltransferase